MRRLLPLGIVFGTILLLVAVFRFTRTRLTFAESPLRNHGHRNPALRLDSIIDLDNRADGGNAVSTEPDQAVVATTWFEDQDHRATLGYVFKGVPSGKRAPLILVQTEAGEYLQTLCGPVKNEKMQGVSCLSVHPVESFYLVAWELGEEVGRWRISGLSASYDAAAAKDKHVSQPPLTAASNPTGLPQGVSLRLELAEKKVADGFTRCYRLHYELRTQDPSKELEKMSIANAFFSGFFLSMLSRSGTCVPSSSCDRAHYFSVIGNLVALPGRPHPVHFSFKGNRVWEDSLGGGKVRIKPSPKYGNELDYECVDGLIPQLITYQGALISQLDAASGSVFAELPEASFDAGWFDQTGSPFTGTETFRAVVDASKPDVIGTSKPLLNKSGQWGEIQSRMFSF